MAHLLKKATRIRSIVIEEANVMLIKWPYVGYLIELDVGAKLIYGELRGLDDKHLKQMSLIPLPDVYS